MCKFYKRTAKIVIKANTSIKICPLTTPFPENLVLNKKSFFS